MTNATQCGLCDELAGASLALWPTISGGVAPPRVVLENERYVAMVTVGPIVRGHCLIVPRWHRESMALADMNDCSCAEAFLHEVATLMRRVYRKEVLVFEHGSRAGASSRPCSVGHAHWHVTPTDVQASQMLMGNYSWQRVPGPFVVPTHEYLLVGDEGKNYWVAYSYTPIPSQVLRRRLANLANPESQWDWRQAPDVETTLATIADLTAGLADNKRARQQ